MIVICMASLAVIFQIEIPFLLQFWWALFKLKETSLLMSSSYHLQSDGQTEVINRGLQQYLHCFVHESPTNGEVISIGRIGVITPQMALLRDS